MVRPGLSLGLAIASCIGTARADGESTDETLKRFFPDRDLSKAALKFVDRANEYFAVGDTLEVTKDGRVRTTNAVVIQVVRGQPNGVERFTAHEGPRMLLKFAKPIRMPSDLAGNSLVSIEQEK